MGGSLMNKSKDNEQQIDIKRMIEVVLDRIVSIVVITIIFGLISYGLSEYLLVKKYESTVTMVIYNRRDLEITDTEYKTNASDITASRDLVPTCIEIIKRDAILQTVAENISETKGKKYTAGKIRNMLSVEEVLNTYIIKISVLDTDRVMSRDIANEIGTTVELKMREYIPLSTVKVVDFAKVSSVPASPNVRNNTILGALLGFVLSISVILLKELFDIRVKSADDLVNRFNYPVLGAIPEIYVSYDDSSNNEESES